MCTKDVLVSTCGGLCADKDNLYRSVLLGISVFVSLYLLHPIQDGPNSYHTCKGMLSPMAT